MIGFYMTGTNFNNNCKKQQQQKNDFLPLWMHTIFIRENDKPWFISEIRCNSYTKETFFAHLSYAQDEL